MSWWHSEDWRWEPRHHATPTVATIAVSEPNADQKAEREQKIKDGARVTPFGFSRAIGAAREVEPLLWEGDDS